MHKQGMKKHACPLCYCRGEKLVAAVMQRWHRLWICCAIDMFGVYLHTIEAAILLLWILE